MIPTILTKFVVPKPRRLREHPGSVGEIISQCGEKLAARS